MHFTGDITQLELGLNALLDFLATDCTDTIEVVQLTEDTDHVLDISRGTICRISYKKKHHFFRALSLYLQFVEEETDHFSYSEKAIIPTCGAMIDVSRNSVYRLEKVKELLVKLSLMGHSTCMLYTEDTYQLPEYPYFGYLRGAYTQEELKALDAYAYQLGIELIPCIQTLAHLKQTLKWNYASQMKDTSDVLLVNAPETYAFLDYIFQTLKDTFSTRRIHIGMDEAFDLGRGNSIEKNGFKHHSELMAIHLEKVGELLHKHQLEPMMWDDMFLRGTGPHANQYDPNAEVDPSVVSSVPPNMSLVYWDYYHTEESFYTSQFEKRSVFNNPLIFAGGVWKWMGYAPHYHKTFVTTHAALSACKKKGIQEVLATMWGDDGDETPIDASLLGLILFAEHTYHSEVSDEWLNRRCEFLTGLSSEDFMSLQDLDLIPGVEQPNIGCQNPSKYFLYQDILLGAFDYYVQAIDLYSYYNELSIKYDMIAKHTPFYSDLFTMYSKLATVLSLKTNIGCLIKEAYDTKDQEGLYTMCEHVLPTLIEDLRSFKESLRTLWYADCKGQGFEVLDIRIGGIISRCETAVYRLESFLNGHINIIEELEEQRLPYKIRYINHASVPSWNQYASISTQNIISHGL